MKLTNQQKRDFKKYSPEISEIRSNLFKIQETGTARINLARYKKMGLVKMGYKTTITGHKVIDRLKLTEKGKRMLKVRL